MFSFIAGAIAGAAYGSMIGCLKYTALWRRIFKQNKKITIGVLYRQLGLSYAINAAALFSIFLARNAMPWSFVATMIAAAVMISLIGKLAPMNEIVGHLKEGAS